jgi:hypothetical protein
VRSPDKRIGVATGRDPLFFFAAALVHAAALLGASAIAPLTSQLDREPAPPALREAGTLEAGHLEIDLVSEEPPRSPEIALASRTDIAAAAPLPASRLSSTEPSRRERRPAEPRPEPSADVGSAPTESSPPPEPGWLPNGDPSSGRAPGIDGAPVWAIPGVLPAKSAASSRPLAPRATSPAHRAPPPGENASEEQKQAALFPAAGTLASAVAEEVSTSSAPPVSESRFKLTLDAQGRLISALFLSANEGERSAWERVARAVGKRFAGKSMPLPSAFSGGATVYVTVSSRVVMPDGTTHGAPVPRSPLEKAPENEYGRIESPLNDRFRSPMTNTSPSPNKVTAGYPFVFDISNLGAKRRRVVRAAVQAVPTPPAAAP